MFKRLAVLTLTLLLLASCAPEAALPTRSVDDSAPPGDGTPITAEGEADGLSGHLTITTGAGYETMLYRYTSAFTGLHPDVTVTIHTLNTGPIPDRINSATTLATELLAGQGDDLIMSYLVPYAQYARLGIFADLSEFLDREPEFKQDFYPRLLDTVTVDGGIYALPRSVAFPAYWANGLHSKKTEALFGDQVTLTFPEAIEAFESVRGSASAPQHVGNLFCAGALYAQEIHHFYDPNARYVNFGQEFISMVNEIAPYAIPDSNNPPGTTISLFETYLGLSNIYTSANLLPGEARRAWVAAGTDGGYYSFDPGDMYAINANSESKELAWEFLKFYGSNEALELAVDWTIIPVRKSVLYGIILARGESNKSATAPGTDTLRTLIDLLDVLMESENFLGYLDGDPFRVDIMQAAFDDYNAGLLTAEQLAARLQEKLTLYVNQ